MLNGDTLRAIVNTSNNADEIWNKLIYEKQKECMNCMYSIRCETHGNYLCLKHIHEEDVECRS
jgi:hypothetical protein